MHLLLVRLRPIGDVVFTTPLLSALRRRYPDARLTYLVEPGAAAVLENNPHVAELIVVPRRRGVARVQDDLAMGMRLARGRYDIAIDLHGGPRSAWLTWASRAPRRIGYSIQGRQWMYTQVVPRSRELTPRHSVLNQWDLIAPLGIPALDPAQDPVQMYEDPRATRRVDDALAALGVDQSHALIVIHVSASTRFKRWPEDSFVSLIVSLAMADASRRVLVISGPSDAEAAQRISVAARARLGARSEMVLESRHISVSELRPLISRAAVYIGGDSGPLHIAATTTVPIVELLGPTLAERSSPWRDPGLFTEIIEPGTLPCRPCDQRTCAPGDFRCLTGISTDRVHAAVERALRWSGPPRDPATSGQNERRIPVVQ